LFSFFNLVQNEIFKLRKQIGHIIILGLFACIVLITSFIIREFRGNLTDFYFGAGFIFAFIDLWIIVIAGNIVSSEFRWGTVKLLLTRPHNRLKILYAKYVTVLLAIIFVVLMFIIIFLLMLLITGNINIERNWDKVFLKIFFYTIEVVIYATLAFMISSLSRSSALAIGASVFVLYPVKWMLPVLDLAYQGSTKLILFTHADLSPHYKLSVMSNLFGSGGANLPLTNVSLTFAIVVILVYFVIFHFVSSFFFWRKDIT